MGPLLTVIIAQQKRSSGEPQTCSRSFSRSSTSALSSWPSVAPSLKISVGSVGGLVSEICRWVLAFISSCSCIYFSNRVFIYRRNFSYACLDKVCYVDGKFGPARHHAPHLSILFRYTRIPPGETFVAVSAQFITRLTPAL